jgi:hypothetical protein
MKTGEIEKRREEENMKQLFARTTYRKSEQASARRGRLWLAILTAAVLALPTLAQAGDVTSYSTRGPCTEVFLEAVVKVETLSQYIPEGYEVADDGGLTDIGVFSEDCLQGIDGGPLWSTTLSGIGVSGTAPDGGDGGFSITWTTDSNHIYKAYRSLGYGELVRDSSFELVEVAGQTIGAEASVPGGALPFSFSVSLVEPAPDDALDEFRNSVHWAHGSRGFVRGDYDHTFQEGSAVVGELRAEPGSPLAEILGAERVETAGFFFHFDHTGTVELWQG